MGTTFTGNRIASSQCLCPSSSNPFPYFTCLVSSWPRIKYFENWRSASNKIRFSRRRATVAELSSNNVDSHSFEMPCLPVSSDKIFIPSATKMIHLYEAQSLTLLEEAIEKHSNHFVHFVWEPILFPGGGEEISLEARYGCLSLIEKVDRLAIGALVTIRGVGRVSITTLSQTEPYIRGLVQPLQDEIPIDHSLVNAAVHDLKLLIIELQHLQLKLKTFKDAQLLTPLWSSFRWAEKGVILNCYTDFLPSLAERMSFAALQPITGATGSELNTLRNKNAHAMELRSTLQRLGHGINYIKQSKAMVAARLALQSLEH